MKKIIKGISVLMCFAIISVLFSGCGKSKTIKVSEMFEKDNILYKCESGDGTYEKNTTVQYAYLILDDTLMFYEFDSQTTLGEIDKMGDEEIRSMIEEEYNSKLDTVLEPIMSEMEPLLSANQDGIASKLNAIAEQRITDISETEFSNSNYIVDADEYIERYNYETINYQFKNLFDVDDENRNLYYTSYDTEHHYDEEKEAILYTVKFNMPIEEVRNQINAFYEKYPSVKEGIETVINGGDAETAAANIIETVSAPVKESGEYKTAKAEAEKILNENNGYKYKLVLFSDASGNNTLQEGFVYQEFDLKYEDGKVVPEFTNYLDGVSTAVNYKDYPAQGLEDGAYYYEGDYKEYKNGNCVPIYDSFYGGWSYIHGNYSYAVCSKFKKNCSVVLDELDEKKFIIDPTDDDVKTAFD